ncbi:MAG TPA: GIY-YIG nuclease family protein [Chloroflexota bacterium]|nr:GIY-YIG nuclease family protein [Chloroflexota bacterium]
MYIMTNIARTLYTGMTNDLVRRVLEHKAGRVPGFTSKYKLTKLVYFESTPYVLNAIQREKQIKGWDRAKRVALVESMNPQWTDLLPELGTDSSLRS